jgi:hypothetical protein
MEIKKNLPEQDELFLEMSECLPPLYFPISFEDDDIHQLAIDEFCRVRGIICREYKFDEDKYMEENGGTSPFDFVRNDIEQEVYARIRKDNNLLHLVAIRKETIRTIREAVEKENNIIGTFYCNRGEHFWLGEIAEEYENSPIVVTQNKEYDTYGSYDANTVYELFINSEGILFCTLNGESGENFDEPIEHVQIEGLIDIKHWLEEQGFICRETAKIG